MKDFWIFDVEFKIWYEFSVDLDTLNDADEGLAHHKFVCISSAIT